MATKEEILNKYTLDVNEEITDRDLPEETIIYTSDALKMLDEYAKQERIEFAKWLQSPQMPIAGYSYHGEDGWLIIEPTKRSEERRYLTDEQLDNLYLQFKTK